MSPIAQSRPIHPATAGAALIAVLALSLTACGASGSTATDQPSAGGGQAGARADGQGGRLPGVSGKIAAIDGKTLQVQSAEVQTAVTYTAKTTFTQVGAASAAALKTGLCATVRSTGDASASATAGPVTAGSVTLAPAVDGSCAGGFGGARPSGAPSGRGSGAGSDQPSGAPSGGPGRGMGRGASGKVLSVDGAGFVVESADRSNETVKITVTTTADTTWSEVATTTARALAVGKCATANGPASSSGAVTATTLRLSQPTNGTCGVGFGGGRARQAGDPGQPGTGAPTRG